MKKIKDLRTAIEAALPEFKGEPGRLVMWVEDGAAQSRQTEALGFGFAYRLNVLFVETRTDLALITLALFRWLRDHQPDLLRPAADGFEFDADILDNSTSDILVRLTLTENVAVTPREEGGWQLDYLPELDPLFEDQLPLEGLDDTPPLAELVTDPVEVAP